MNRVNQDRIRSLLAWGLLVVVETTAQLAMRHSGDITGAVETSLFSVTAALALPWIWLALGCYVIGFVAWMYILRESDLSRAFPTSAVVFITVMTSSWLLLNEPIQWRQVVGSIIILIGILKLGPDQTAVVDNPSTQATSGER